MPVIELTLDSSGAIQGLKQYEAQAQKAGKATDGLRSKVNDYAQMAAVAASGVAAAGAAFATMAVKAASDMEETQGKFNVVFKGMTADAEAWADTLASSFGMSEQEAKKYLSSIQDLLVPMGMARDQAGQMSNEIVQLSADLGSFNNLPTAKVMDDIQSALVGNYETMKKYGVILTASTVEQEVYNLGLAKTKDEITAADKAQAAYSIMVKNSADAIGDFNRTQDSFANQMKIAKATLADFTTQAGEILLPYATQLITAFNKWAKEGDGLNTSMKVIIEVLRALYNGFKGLQLVAHGLVYAFAFAFESITNGVLMVIKPMDMLLAGFEKLGWIAENPLDKVRVATHDFTQSAKEGLAKVWQETEKVNATFDQMSAKVGKTKENVESAATSTDNAMQQEKDAVDEAKKAIDEKTDSVVAAQDITDQYGAVVAETTNDLTMYEQALANIGNTSGILIDQTEELANVTTGYADAVERAAGATISFSTAGPVASGYGAVVGPQDGESAAEYYNRLGVVSSKATYSIVWSASQGRWVAHYEHENYKPIGGEWSFDASGNPLSPAASGGTGTSAVDWQKRYEDVNAAWREALAKEKSKSRKEIDYWKQRHNDVDAAWKEFYNQEKSKYKDEIKYLNAEIREQERAYREMRQAYENEIQMREREKQRALENLRHEYEMQMATQFCKSDTVTVQRTGIDYVRREALAVTPDKPVGVTINVNQAVSRSDIVNIANELQRLETR